MSIQDWEPGQQSFVEKSLEKTESIINTTQGGYKGELITGLSQKLALETQDTSPDSKPLSNKTQGNESWKRGSYKKL